MINYADEELFELNSINKQWRIQVYDGDTLENVITNVDLYNQEITLKRFLCSKETLVYGTCESDSLKFKVNASVGTLSGKKLIVYVTPSDGEVLRIGVFYVVSDKISDDRKSRDIESYDALYKIINANTDEVAEWYAECGLPLTLKDFRDSFFEHFGVEQEEVDLVNDTFVVTETVLPEVLKGVDILSDICEINGCLGTITNEGEFRYVFLNNPDEKTYTASDYKQGTIKYEDFTVRQATSLKVYSNNDIEVTIGSGDNQYVIEDNFLFYDKLESVVTEIAHNIYDIIKDTLAYTPLEVETYGNPCVELGDYITIETANGNTLSTYVFGKTMKGLQALSDSFDTNGTEYFEYNLTDSNSQIRRLWNNTIALQNEIYGARTYVYAHRNVSRFNIGASEETEIIRITIATVDATIPIFLATIPLIMDCDGEIIFRYYVDGLQIENDIDKIYLTTGEQFVTLTTFFELSKNTQARFTVTAQTAYRESVERQQTAKIISLKDWIDNQSISIDEDTGEASFDYDYVDTPVDTTPPGAVINLSKIRAMLFASGLAPTEPWDGTLLFVEEAADWNLIELTFENASDSVTVNTQTPTTITLTDNASEWNLIELTFDNATDTVYINMYTETYQVITEDGLDVITEDGLTLYTEGD